MTSTSPVKEPQTESPLQQYYFRAIVCFAAAGTLASFINWDNISYLLAGAIIFVLIYAYATYHFTHKLPPESLARVGRWLSYCDAALIGIVLSLTNFSILPCILFLTMIQFNALLSGGLRKLLEDNAAFGLGVLASLIIR